MGAQTISQISDYYTDMFFMCDEYNLYKNTPDLIKKIDKQSIVNLAREYIGSGISGFVAVSSCEKSLITNLAAQLKF